MRFNLKMEIIKKFGNQANFARACNKSDDWISRIIMGRRRANEEDRKLIASKLKVRVKDLNNLFEDAAMK